MLWDLDRPLEGDCNIELLNFDSREGKEVFWHSTAHVLGEAMERRYVGCLCYGPPIESGFYYDMHMPEVCFSSCIIFGYLSLTLIHYCFIKF